MVRVAGMEIEDRVHRKSLGRLALGLRSHQDHPTDAGRKSATAVKEGVAHDSRGFPPEPTALQ